MFHVPVSGKAVPRGGFYRIGKSYRLASEPVICYKPFKPTTNMKTPFICFASLAAVAAAAPLPDYPVVYNPQTGGPVSNPAFGRQEVAPAPSVPSPVQAQPGFQTPPVSPTYRLPRYMDPTCYEVNVSFEYGFKATPDHRYACDVVGAELEGAFTFAKRQAVTLSLGFAGGGQTNDFWVVDDDNFVYPFTDSYDRTSFTLMVGYRYTQPVGKNWVVQVGAKCGMDVQTLDIDYGFGWSGYYYDYPYYDEWNDGQRDTDVGLAFAGYVNIGYRLSPNAMLYVGYQFRGSTAQPKMNYDIPDVPHEKTGSMRWHEVRLGISFNF